MVDISKAVCPDCSQAMTISHTSCEDCGLSLEGGFEVSALGRLSVADQAFVAAFVRVHGSIKKMEGLFEISYPTVKNRLNSVASRLDRTFEAPSPSSSVLDDLEEGEITVEEALERLS